MKCFMVYKTAFRIKKVPSCVKTINICTFRLYFSKIFIIVKYYLNFVNCATFYVALINTKIHVKYLFDNFTFKIQF